MHRSGRGASPTPGSFLRPHRKCDEDTGFLEALRNKYAPADSDELNDHKAIRISGKTVEEVGFERINQQLARLPELQAVVLDGFCVFGVVSRRRKLTNNQWALELRKIQDQGRCPSYSIISFATIEAPFLYEWLKLTSMLPIDLHIQDLDLSRNLFEDFADVVAIARALKSLKVLKLKYVRNQC